MLVDVVVCHVVKLCFVQDQSRLLGFVSATVATVCSGFAGVFFEKILKGSEVSVWMRNVQLSVLSIPSGVLFVFFKDGEAVIEQVNVNA